MAVTSSSAVCCFCGVQTSNSDVICGRCHRAESRITGFSFPKKPVVLFHCPKCDSYLKPPKKWVRAPRESNDLLQLCLNRMNKHNREVLDNARFVRTEPHSKRIEVRLTLREEVIPGIKKVGDRVVSFIEKDRLCNSCIRVQGNPDQWAVVVQVRQHVFRSRTLVHLEKLILKHDAAAQAIKIKYMSQGIDLFFTKKSHASKFVNLISMVTPAGGRKYKRLASHDMSNTRNYKYAISFKIPPIFDEDLVCLPRKLIKTRRNLGPLVICTKVTDRITLLDPLTLRILSLDAEEYWKWSLKPLFTTRHLVEYIVLDIAVDPEHRNVTNSSRYALADAWLARVADFGKNDDIIFLKTHLGHVLSPGDYALGYDLKWANTSNTELHEYYKLDAEIPTAILVKKSYRGKWQGSYVHGKPCPSKLRSLEMEVGDCVDEEKMDVEYEEFLKDLEENSEQRFNISLYRNRDFRPSDQADNVRDDGDVPSAHLEELLADLDLSDG